MRSRIYSTRYEVQICCVSWCTSIKLDKQQGFSLPLDVNVRRLLTCRWIADPDYFTDSLLASFLSLLLFLNRLGVGQIFLHSQRGIVDVNCLRNKDI